MNPVRWHLWPPHQFIDTDTCLNISAGMPSSACCDRKDDQISLPADANAQPTKSVDETIDTARAHLRHVGLLSDGDETCVRMDDHFVGIGVAVRLRAVPPQFREVVVGRIEAGQQQQCLGRLLVISRLEGAAIYCELDVGLVLLTHVGPPVQRCCSGRGCSLQQTPYTGCRDGVNDRGRGCLLSRTIAVHWAPVDDDTATLGRRLRSIRTSQNRSLTDVAERAGISKAYLSQLERDDKKQPGYDIVVRLSTALGVSVEMLTGRPAVWDPSSDSRYPDTLVAFAERAQLPKGDIEMLAHVHYRGKQPSDVDDWAHIYETIRRTIR